MSQNSVQKPLPGSRHRSRAFRQSKDQVDVISDQNTYGYDPQIFSAVSAAQKSKIPVASHNESIDILSSLPATAYATQEKTKELPKSNKNNILPGDVGQHHPFQIPEQSNATNSKNRPHSKQNALSSPPKSSRGVAPVSINKRFKMLKELPTSYFQKGDQNQKDGLDHNTIRGHIFTLPTARDGLPSQDIL